MRIRPIFRIRKPRLGEIKGNSPGHRIGNRWSQEWDPNLLSLWAMTH